MTKLQIHFSAFWITIFNGLKGLGASHYDINISKYAPPPLFISLLVVSSRSKQKTRALLSPCPPSVTMVCGLFNLLPLPMSSTGFLVPTIVITLQPDHTSFLSSPHSYVAFPQSTFNLLPCWLLEASSTNMIILYFSFYDSVILSIQLFLFSTSVSLYRMSAFFVLLLWAISLVAQSCPALCYPMDCSMPGFLCILLLFNHFEACRAPEMPYAFFFFSQPLFSTQGIHWISHSLHYSSLKLYHFLLEVFFDHQPFDSQTTHLLRGSTVVNRVYDTKAKLDVRCFVSLSPLDADQTEKNGHDLL